MLGKEGHEHFFTLLLQLSLLTAQYGMNLGLCLGGGNVVQPICRHQHIPAGKNLHLVATLQTMRQRHQTMIHLGTYAMGTQCRVYAEGKIQYGTLRWHGLEITLRSNHHYLVGIQIQLDGIQKVHGIGLGVIQYLLDGREPLLQLVFAILLSLASILVFPMGSKTLLCNIVHAA